ncbi:GNAT family N-acetyltransferase [Devosia sp.]|uniref:GNAT family N-acetyltransferase n=1 Tax=Devosia sp. TaxID=1871048 RepID=UPI002FCAACB8
MTVAKPAVTAAHDLGLGERDDDCVAAVEVTIDIHDLRQAPEYWATVADRIWKAWWRPYGAALTDVEVALADVARAANFPSFTLVAVGAGKFVGTVTALEDDIESRPDLGPCIAALWVESADRGHGIGASLVRAACDRLADAGFRRVYLGAKPPLRSYYSGHGWTLLESGVGGDDLDVFVRALP